MEYASRSEFNIYEVKPREVFMHDDEREALKRHTETRINRLLDTEATSIITSTDTPIPLEVRPNIEPSPEMVNIVKLHYDSAHVSIRQSVKDGQRQFQEAIVTLQRTGTPLRGWLMLRSDRVDDTDNHPLNPQFTFAANTVRTPHQMSDNERIPAAAANRLLHELVSQANEYEAITHPNMSIYEKLVALADPAKRILVERSAHTVYHFIPKGEDIGRVSVEMHDARVYDSLDKPPHSIGSTVEVIKHQAIHKDMQLTSYADIRCRLSNRHNETSAKISMQFGDIEPTTQYAPAAEVVMDTYCDIEGQYPSEFSTQIMRGLDIAESPSDDYVKEVLY